MRAARSCSLRRAYAGCCSSKARPGSSTVSSSAHGRPTRASKSIRLYRKGRNEQGADTFYIQASRSRSAALTSGYPQRLEDLFTYDALVLANVESSQLTSAELEATRNVRGPPRRRPARPRCPVVRKARTRRDARSKTCIPLQLVWIGRRRCVPGSSSRGMNLVSLTPAGESAPCDAARILARGHPEEVGCRAGAGIGRAAWRRPPRCHRPCGDGWSRRRVAGAASPCSVTVRAARWCSPARRRGAGACCMPSSDRSYDTFWRQALRMACAACRRLHVAIASAAASPASSEPWLRPCGTQRSSRSSAPVELFVTRRTGGSSGSRRARSLVRTRKAGHYVGALPGRTGWRVSGKRGGATRGGTARYCRYSAARRRIGCRDGRSAVERRRCSQRLPPPPAAGSWPGSGRRSGRARMRSVRGIPAARWRSHTTSGTTAESFAMVVTLLGTEWMLRRRVGD